MRIKAENDRSLVPFVADITNNCFPRVQFSDRSKICGNYKLTEKMILGHQCWNLDVSNPIEAATCGKSNSWPSSF